MLVGPRRLARGRRHAQVELLAAQLLELVAQVRLRLAAQGLEAARPFLDVLPAHQRTCRRTNAVATESLAAASLNASRAVSSGTPSISNSTLPGVTLATQYSTLPLPLPMRTSSGFCVIGTSGNTRIQIWPPRFT